MQLLRWKAISFMYYDPWKINANSIWKNIYAVNGLFSHLQGIVCAIHSLQMTMCFEIYNSYSFVEMEHLLYIYIIKYTK